MKLVRWFMLSSLAYMQALFAAPIDPTLYPALEKFRPDIEKLNKTEKKEEHKKLLTKLRRAIRRSYKGSKKSDEDVKSLKKALDSYTKIKSAIDQTPSHKK